MNVGVAEKLGYTRFDKRFPANGISVSGVGPWCEITCFTHTSWAPVEPNAMASDVKAGKVFFRRFPPVMEIV